MSAPVSCPPALTSPEPETPSSRTGRTRPAPGRVVRDRPPDWAEVPRPRDGSHLRNVAPAARGIEGRTGDTRRQPPGYKLGARLKARPVPARSDPASPDADLLLRRRPDQCSRWQREHHPLTAGVLIQVAGCVSGCPVPRAHIPAIWKRLILSSTRCPPTAADSRPRGSGRIALKDRPCVSADAGVFAAGPASEQGLA